jgi:hypothetical protein
VNPRATWLCAIAALVASVADACAAGPYKCSDQGGGIVYQQQPCPPGQEIGNLAETPSAVSMVPFAHPPPPDPPRKTRAEKAPRPPSKEKQRASGDALERRHVKEGMSEGEVLAKVGAPDLQSGRGRLMRWTYLPAAGDPQTVTVVRFEDGKVKEVDRRILR